MTTTIRQPKVNVNIVNANVAVENTGQKILFVGEGVGSAAAGALVDSIPNDGSEDGLFGPKSMLAAMIRANKSRNQQVRVDAIPVVTSTGAKAVIDIDLTGAASETGTLTVIAGSERNHKFTVAVASGTSLTDIATNIKDAVNVDTRIPFVVTSGAAVVTFTAIENGKYGNTVPLEVRGEIAGLTVLVSFSAQGSGEPTLTSTLDVIGENRYQAIVWGYADVLAPVVAHLDALFNADGKVHDGVAFTATSATSANLISLGNGFNSQSLVIFGEQIVSEDQYRGPAVVEIPIVTAAYFAGFRGLRLDADGFNIADFTIVNNGPLDSFGGPALASKPYFNIPFADLVPIQTGRGFDDAEIEGLKEAGISVVASNVVNNTIISGEVVTTYKTDFAGNPDVTFTFLNYVDTASQAREYFFNNLRARFAQSRLTEGDVIKGRDMANELVIRSFLKRLYQDLSGVDFVLLEAGEAALTFFDGNLIIDIDKALGKVTIQMTVPIVTQLREIAATMKIAFDTQA